MPSWLDTAADFLRGLEPLRLDLLGRLLLAAFLGGAVGVEREVQAKPAGLRTNMLICLGAALLTEISIGIARFARPAANPDPARLAAQIVSGIGFLGAGTIIQARGHVTGLTTAATLWVVAAIGIAVGAHAYVEALGTTALVLIALIPLAYVESHLVRQRQVRMIRFTLADDPLILGRIEERLQEAGLRVRCHEVERRPEAALMVAVFESVGPEERVQALFPALLRAEGVRAVAID
ncbi:MAG: MgtC/SapB family protein [Gemmatimonadetes bacterium]|nr:MgtC/SapB family protein [Gemmatimonadota bacterium]